MGGVVLRAGEGEALFGGRIVIKADFEELSITESLFPDARPGASPHFHRQHADSFYVLDGELAFLIEDEEKPLPQSACVCAPPNVVHGFRSTSPARFLNFHTPDGGFAKNLQARDRGEPGGFDSFDAPEGSGPSGSDAKSSRSSSSSSSPASKALSRTPTTITSIRSTPWRASPSS